MKILIVDDIEENRILLYSLLTGFGYQVEQADNGKEALQKLKKVSFDMVISDILMPVMDGYELCQKCKSDPELQKLYFIFYTATYTDKEDEKYAMQLGADKFLIKPIDPKDFMAVINSIVKTSEQGKFPPHEPEISDIETIRGHRDRLLNKLSKKVDQLNTEIDERKKAEAKYWKLIESTPQAIIIHCEGAIVYSNQAGYKLLEADSSTSLFGKKLLDFVHPDSHKIITEGVHKLLAGDSSAKYWEVKFQSLKGKKIDVEVTSLPTIYNSKAAVQILIGDITERKQAEETLRKSEDKFKNIFEAANVGKSITLPTGEINVNRAFAEMLGYTREELKNKTWQELTPVNEILNIQKLLDSLLKGEKDSTRFNKRYIHKNGSFIWTDISVTIRRDDAGIPLYFITTVVNISERKHAEEALRSANERLKNLQQITETVHESLELNIIFERITNAVVQSIGFSTAILLTLDEKGENYLVRSLSSSNLSLAKIDKIAGFPFKKLSVPVSGIDELAQKAVTTGEMVMVNHLCDIASPTVNKTICDNLQKLSNNKCYILAPLIFKGKLIGGLIASSSNTPDQLQRADIEMLKTFASTAIQAIANADLLAETNRAKEQIQMNLQEKELLLRELYHRTKNNMQVIASMLRIHASRLQDEKLKRICYDVENKILSMAIVHQKLYESQNLSHLNLKEYYSNLLSLLNTSYDADNITFSIEGDDIKVLIDTAIPCGLILNELITNSIRHAFPDNRKGEIKVNLYLTRKNELVIEVADNGIGLPSGFNIKKDMHLGLESVIVLVEHQLQGKIEFKSNNGLLCRIVLKEELYQPRI